MNDQDMYNLIKLNKSVFEKNTGKHFPVNPSEQLEKAIKAVFGSWNTPRAIKYREINNIKNLNI